MSAIVRAFPVVYACQGCAEFGQSARELGALLDQVGLAELVWLGAAREPKPKQRYPILALDGCDKACARAWLERHGVAPDGSFVLARC